MAQITIGEYAVRFTKVGLVSAYGPGNAATEALKARADAGDMEALGMLECIYDRALAQKNGV